jgi:hypothetical protein
VAREGEERKLHSNGKSTSICSMERRTIESVIAKRVGPRPLPEAVQIGKIQAAE